MSAVSDAKALLAAGKLAEAASALRAALDGPLDYLAQMNAAKLIERLAADLPEVRLAVLGSTTTAQLLPLLRLHAFKEGLRLELYEGPFGAYQQEILDPASGLYAFKPRAVLLYVNHRDARPGGDPEAEAARWAGLWSTLRERPSAARRTAAASAA